MGHHEHCHPVLRQAAHHGQHLADQFRIQGAGGLVKIDDFRIRGHGPGNRHPLLLSAGQLGRIAFQFVGHPDLFQHLHRFGFRLLFVHADAARQAEGHVLQHGLVLEQVVVLEHKACLPPQPRDILFLYAVQLNLFPVKDHSPAVRLLQEIQAAQESRLSGSAGAQDCHHVALLHIQADAVQHRLPAEALSHIPDLKHHARTPP